MMTNGIHIGDPVSCFSIYDFDHAICLQIRDDVVCLALHVPGYPWFRDYKGAWVPYADPSHLRSLCLYLYAGTVTQAWE